MVAVVLVCTRTGRRRWATVFQAGEGLAETVVQIQRASHAARRHCREEGAAKVFGVLHRPARGRQCCSRKRVAATDRPK